MELICVIFWEFIYRNQSNQSVNAAKDNEPHRRNVFCFLLIWNLMQYFFAMGSEPFTSLEVKAPFLAPAEE